VKVRMLITRLAALDGIRVEEFKAGGVYELPLSLSEAWLAQGVCEQDKMDAGPSEFKGGAMGSTSRKKKAPKEKKS